MSGSKKKTSIYLVPAILECLLARAAEASTSIPDIIREALSLFTSEDAEGIVDFDTRIGEPNVGYAEFVQSLKADGII